MVGETLSHYEILEPLGQYRFGPVYKARDLQSDGLAAIQLIDPTVRTKLPEAPALVAFDGPVARVLDAGQEERVVWIASELLEGVRLSELLEGVKAAGGCLPRDAIIEIALNVVEGIAHLHTHGMIHGNLTSRCIVGGRGSWRIAAFDISGLISGSAFGEAGIRRDIQSAGELIHEVATAEPFSELHESALPPELAPIVRRSLAVNPRDSYKDVDGLLADLRRLAGGQLTESAGVAQVRSSSQGIPAGGRQFQNGQLVAERFRIIRFVARGGMGEVYEAEDLELRERVALKTVRSDAAADQPSVERFRREIQLARRITHPNVCRIFDLFRHPVSAASSSEPPVLFLTMELLNGQTLADRIHSSGPLPQEEAAAIVAQLAAGLEAAHNAGILHRDFKSANVILAGADPERPSRAVITDFGLAGRFAQVGDLTMSLAGAGFAGTPAYMAPEQVRGEELTPASDVYALGIVMYEMITGVLPFAENSPLATALKRLQESPVTPRIHRPELSDAWEATILKCLELEPGRRLQRAAEVVDTLAGKVPVEPASAKEPPASPRPLTRPRNWWIPVTAIMVLLAALAGVYSVRLRNTGTSRLSVAVLGFRNLAGAPEAAWLSNAFAEMLTTELSAGERLRTVSGENIARMKADLGLKEVETSLARDTLSRIRGYLGSDVIAFGSYLIVGEKGGERVRLDLRLQDARTGEIVASVTDDVPVTELLGLVSRAGARLRGELGVAPLSSAEAVGLKASLPSNQESARLYIEGLARLRVFEAAEARRVLEKAVEIDPEFALARSALGTAWSMSGYARRAKVEAGAALKLSGRLPREERLLVEARFHEAAGNWDQAAEAYRTLFGFFPDNLDYGLRLAGTRISAGKAHEAFPVLDALRKLPAPDRDSARIDLTASRAAGARGDYQQQRKSAAAVIAKAEAQGAKLLAAGGRLLEGIALQNLGDLQQAIRTFERSRADYLKAGDRWGAANAANNLAVVRARNGDLEEARREHDDALALYRQLGDKSGEAAALSSLASLLRAQGKFAEARMLHAEAIGIYRETGDRPNEARALNNLANTLASAGELSEAKKAYEAALPIFTETGDQHAVGTILTNLAGLRFDEGDLTAAMEMYEKARALFDRAGAQSSLAFVLYRLGDLHFAKGNLAAAREHHEKALEIRKRLGEKGGVAESELGLAQVALHENRPVPAEALARDAIVEFRNEKRLDEEAMAHSVLARALLSQRRVAEAGEAARSARMQAEASGNPAARLAIRTTAASVEAAAGKTQAAMETLNSVITEARRSAFVGLEFEARLALGQLEISGANPAAGRARLAALEKEAAAKGYSGIAKRAAQPQ